MVGKHNQLAKTQKEDILSKHEEKQVIDSYYQSFGMDMLQKKL